MRVVELIRGLGLGGAEALLVTRMSTTEAAKWSTTIVNTHPAQSHFLPSLEALGTPVTSVGGNVLTSSWRTWRIAGGLERNSILVSHSPSIGLVLKARRALGFGRDQTLVDVVHNSTFRPLYLLFGRLLNRHADAALFVGHDVSTSTAARGYRRSFIVHGGVPRLRFHKWLTQNPDFAVEVRRTVGARAGTVLLVSVGGLTRVKDHALAIDAVAQLGSRHQLVVVGEGAERERLEAHARGRGVPVHFAGCQPEAWRWIAAADALLHTSVYEGLPVVLMEAAALGVPIVATPFQGVREMERSGVRISVAETHDALAVARAVERLQLSPGAESRPLTSGAEYWSAERFAQDFYAALDDSTNARHGLTRGRPRVRKNESVARDVNRIRSTAHDH